MTEHLDILERLSKRGELVDVARSAMHGEPHTRAIAAKVLARSGGRSAVEALQWRLDRAINEQERRVFEQCIAEAWGAEAASGLDLNDLERMVLGGVLSQPTWMHGRWTVLKLLLWVVSQAHCLKRSESPRLSRWARHWLDRHNGPIQAVCASMPADASCDSPAWKQAFQWLTELPPRAVASMGPPEQCPPDLIEHWPIDRLERLRPWFVGWLRRGKDEVFALLVRRALQCDDPARRVMIEGMVRKLYRHPLASRRSVPRVTLRFDIEDGEWLITESAVETVGMLGYRRHLQDSIDLLAADRLTPEARRLVVEQLCSKPTRSRLQALQAAMQTALLPELQSLLSDGNALSRSQRLMLALHACDSTHSDTALNAAKWLARNLDERTLETIVDRHLELLPDILFRTHRRTLVASIARRPDCLVAAAGRSIDAGRPLSDDLLERLQAPRAREGYESTEAVVARIVRTLTRSASHRPTGRRASPVDSSKAVRLAKARDILGEILKGNEPRWRERRRAMLDRHIHLDLSEIRLHAIQTHQEQPRAEDLPWLLSCARSSDPKVRAKSVEALTARPGGATQAELIASCRDVDDSVRIAAQRAMSRRVELGLTPPDWSELVDRASELRSWGERTGRNLLGRSKVLILNCRVGLGRTTKPLRNGAVVLEVSEAPLTSGHPHGADVVRGLILHELGHQHLDYGWSGYSVARGVARSESISQTFDLLLDERLERGMRSIEPAWGLCFDRLAAYAFVEEQMTVPADELASLHGVEPGVVIDRVRTGSLPGRLLDGPSTERPMVVMRRGEVLRLPGVLPPFWRWAFCLRAGQPDPGDDPRVTEALARVPSNLKSLDHGEVLRLAREIHRLVGCQEEEPDWSSLFRHLNAQRHLRAAVRSWFWQLQAAGMLGIAVLPEASRIRRPDPSRRQRLISIVREARTLSKRKGQDEIDEQRTGRHRRFAYSGGSLEAIPWDNAYNPTLHGQRVAEVAAHVPRLRRCFERLGRVETDEYASTRGNRLDVAMARRVVVNPSPRLLVWRQERHAANIYLGVLVDRSGSMGLNKMQQAVSCAVLVTEAARGLRGICGDVHAFDEQHFYTLGTLQHHTAATLTSGGGNNDASALQLALDQAVASRRRHRLIVVISDGQPTDCSRQELNAAISRARQQGTVVMQVAVGRIEDPVFPNFVDLSSDFQQTVGRMVQTIERLTRTW